MDFKRIVSALAFGTALLASQTAQAADSVYLGDCARAKMIQQQSTIDTLLPHTRYEGIQRMYLSVDATTACPRDYLIAFTLTQKSRSSSAITFDTVRNEFLTGMKPTGCAAPVRHSSPIYGSVTFTTTLQQTGELCEVYIWGAFGQYAPNSTTVAASFGNRILNLDGGSLVLSQPGPVPGTYYTPVAFTGAK